MCDLRAGIWSWVTALAIAMPGFALAQASPPAVPAINTAQCTALTVLAPNPQKLSQDVATATATAAVKAAMAASATPATTELAAKVAAKAAAAEVSATFMLPKPILEGETAEWGSYIKLKFDPVEAHMAKCLESDLILFLDHYPLTGLTPVQRTREPNGTVTLVYRVNRPAASSPGWTELLAKRWNTEGTVVVTVGVGPGSSEVVVADKRVALILGGGGPSWAWIALLCSLILLAGVWRWSKLLEDRRDGFMSYSVSRLLLSLWVLTTMSAVLLMVLRMGVMPSATEGGFTFMLAISGATTGFSSMIDLIRKPSNMVPTNLLQDFFSDADGLAIHRVQVVFFNLLVLYIIWRDLIQFGTVARVDTNWALLMGASAMTFVFGKSGESVRPSVAAVVPPSQPAKT